MTTAELERLDELEHRQTPAEQAEYTYLLGLYFDWQHYEATIRQATAADDSRRGLARLATGTAETA